MAKPRKATGQITFRCPVDQHQDLLEIATALGLDLNGLLNMMLRQALPRYRKKAHEQVQRHLQSARIFSEDVAIPTEEAVIRQMILAARQAPFHQRLEVLQDAAERFGSPGDVPALETVFFAVELMKRATTLHQLRQMREQKTRWSLDDAAEDALQHVEERIVQEIEQLKEKREQQKQGGRKSKER